MRKMPRSSLLSLTIAMVAGAAVAEPARSPDALRHAIEAAEQGHSADLAAQRQAAARARAAADDEARLAAGRIAAATRLRQTEIRLDAESQRMVALAQRRAAVAARLAQRADDLGPLLPVILRLESWPMESLIGMQGSTDDALRGALVLRGVASTLEAQARDLRARQAELAAADAAIAAARPALEAAEAAQRAEAASLDAQLQGARLAHARAEDEADAVARQAAADAARASDLREALARIEADQRAAEARAHAQEAAAAKSHHSLAANDARRRAEELARPAGPGLSHSGVAEPDHPTATLASAATGAPRLAASGAAPVAGHVVRAFGAATEAGPAHGMSIEAPPHARVVAPCTGRVVFAAPFRSFGPMVILDCGGGSHFVLAGLERLDVEVGRPVHAGEPLGVMPGWDAQAGGARPSLYVELRRGGQTIDPAPWLRGS